VREIRAVRGDGGVYGGARPPAAIVRRVRRGADQPVQRGSDDPRADPAQHRGRRSCHASEVGMAPFWAKGKRPDPINARIETVTTGKFFKQLWPAGRALVPSEGWYEWVKDPNDPKKKQPYFIRLKSQKPMFYGALAQASPGLDERDGDGFVIITSSCEQGMVDIHDRRPLVLSPEQARDWLDPDLSARQAEEIARDRSRSEAHFEWYTVGKEVGNVKNQGAQLLLPWRSEEN